MRKKESRLRGDTSPTRASRALLAIASLAVATVALVFAPTVALADPERSLSDVQREVDELHRQAERATERYNEARIRTDEIKAKLAEVQANADAHAGRLADVRQVLGGYANVAYRTGNLDETIQLLLADDPATFLHDTATFNHLSGRQARALEQVIIEGAAYQAAKTAVDTEVRALEQNSEQLFAEKTDIEAKIAHAEGLLASLAEDQRAELADQRASRSGERTPEGATYTGPASGSAREVVDFAYAQLGKPYVYAADGPDSYDCSGLTMRAWAQVGVSLPHSSRMQYSQGTKVSRSDLQPGDLVYFYSPISHVGIYVGDGQIIHATHPGDVVSLDPLSSMPYSGATRP